MLKLEYRRNRDIHQTVVLLGSPSGIADLYWQLTRNYSDNPDGTGVCGIKVTNLDGRDVTSGIMQNHHESSTNLDKLLD